MEGVGNWILQMNEFQEWHTGEDQAVNQVLFYYGDPGVGKTYLRYVKIALLKHQQHAKLTRVRKQKLPCDRPTVR